MSAITTAGFRTGNATVGDAVDGSATVTLMVNDGPEFTAASLSSLAPAALGKIPWRPAPLYAGPLRAVVLDPASGTRDLRDTHIVAAHAARALRGVGVIGLHFDASQVAVCRTGRVAGDLSTDTLVAAVDAAKAALPPVGAVHADDADPPCDDGLRATHVTTGAWSVTGWGHVFAAPTHPGVGMLSILTTDAVAGIRTLANAVAAGTTAVHGSPGLHHDPNGDTVLLLASGASGVAVADAVLAEAVAAVYADLDRQRSLIADHHRLRPVTCTDLPSIAVNAGPAPCPNSTRRR